MFVSVTGLRGAPPHVGTWERTRAVARCDRQSAHVRMLQNPDPKYKHVEFMPYQKPPEGFKWNKEYKGTMPPGQAGDNYPLDTIRDVWKKVNVTVSSMNDREDYIITPMDDFLEVLSATGRLIRSDEEANADSEQEDAKKMRSSVTEQDLDFNMNEEADEFSMYGTEEDMEGGDNSATGLYNLGSDERTQLD